MGVRTKSNELLEETKNCIKDAIKYLTEALDEETWGSDNLDKEYFEELEQMLFDLRKMKKIIP